VSARPIAHTLGALFMRLRIAVGKIQAYDIDSGFDDFVHHFGIIGRRP
jgi:hypothetical protein